MSENEIALIILMPGFVFLAIQLVRVLLVLERSSPSPVMTEGTQDGLDRIMTRDEQAIFADGLSQLGSVGVTVDEAYANLGRLL